MPVRPQAEDAEVIKRIQRSEHRLVTAGDLDPLLAVIGDARYVLLGEASHGTSEFYTWRAQLSQRLISEKGFSFIAVEGDWPDCYCVNRYIKGYNDAGESAHKVLQTFDRWPTWMWANWEIVALTEWLRRTNQQRPRHKQVGFYGLDVYSLWESMESLMGYLTEHVPEAVAAARQAYRCFEPFGGDEQSYAWSTMVAPDTCEDEVVALLSAVQRQVESYADDPEVAFSAEQNALIAVEAERYYRTMVRGDASSWNVRDTHMADTLDRLVAHHATRQGADSVKAIIWEHNTHIGDARATDMAAAGMVNVGQLVRERHSSEGVILVGFGSYQGSVIASAEWGAPMEKMAVPPARPSSWEALLHQAGASNKLLLLNELIDQPVAMTVRGHRAIGVVYKPNQERGNYVPTILPQRYDAFLYIDQTEALHPLPIHPAPAKPPETYPWGV